MDPVGEAGIVLEAGDSGGEREHDVDGDFAGALDADQLGGIRLRASAEGEMG